MILAKRRNFVAVISALCEHAEPASKKNNTTGKFRKPVGGGPGRVLTMEASAPYQLEHFSDEALRLAVRMSKVRRSFREDGEGRGRTIDQQSGRAPGATGASTS